LALLNVAVDLLLLVHGRLLLLLRHVSCR